MDMLMTSKVLCDKEVLVRAVVPNEANLFPWGCLAVSEDFFSLLLLSRGFLLGSGEDEQDLNCC